MESEEYKYNGTTDVHPIGRACPISWPHHYLTIAGKAVVVDKANAVGQHWAFVSNEALKASNKFIIASHPSLNRVLKIGCPLHNDTQKFYKLKVHKVLPDSYAYLPGGDFLDLGPRFHFTTTDVVVEGKSLVQIKHVDTGYVLEHQGVHSKSGGSDGPDAVLAARSAHKNGSGHKCSSRPIANQAWNLND